MELKIPNRIIFSFLKKNNNTQLTDFGPFFKDNRFQKFHIDNVANEVLQYCQNDGKMAYEFLGKGDVIIHPSKSIKDNVYVSILSRKTSYYNKIGQFFNDFKNDIDLSGYTYILNSTNFICEFIRTQQIVAYE